MAINYSEIKSATALRLAQLPVWALVRCSADRTHQAFIAPSPIASGAQSEPSDVQFFCQFSKRNIARFTFKNVSATPIANLFCRCGPLYITHFIMTVIVDAFHRMLGRRFGAQILKKLLERFKAKFNTPPAVAFIGSVCGSIAATLGVTKGSVFRRAVYAGLSVLGVYGLMHFTSPAPARTRLARGQMNARYGRSVATHTNAVPHSAFAVATCKANNQQTSEFVSGQNPNAPLALRFRIYRKIVGSHCSKDNSFVNLVRAAREASTLAWPVCILA